MSLTVREVAAMAENQLREAGVPDYQHDARALLEFALGMSRKDIFMYWTNEIDEFHCDAYLDLAERRGRGEPLQYILGVQNFMGIDISVNENVLIPRQDTEVVVQNAKLIVESVLSKKKVQADSPHIYESLSGRKNWEILDLCCGSGAIGVAMAKLCTNVKKVVCTDISAQAVGVARENSRKAGVEKMMDFHVGDLFGALRKRAKFDMIISNPPYIRTDVIPGLQREVKDHEPLIALDGGADGLDFYRRIVSEAPSRLAKKGVLVMEIGYDQGDAVKSLLEESNAFPMIEIVKDFAGHDRAAIAVCGGK